jgi:hypothetical protein
MTTQAADVMATGVAVRSGNTALSLAAKAVAVRQSLASLVATGLGLAQRRSGIQVPADELVFARTAPVRVAELTLARGDLLSGAVMTATDAVVVVDGSLPLEAATLVLTGMSVQISEPDLGIDETGVVGRVAETPGTSGVDGFHVYFEVIVDGSPPKVVGASVRLTVPIESTGGEVLAVPINALSLASDGSSRVQRQQNGALEFVKVEPGLSADGFVSVTPIEGDLKAGDLVLIGLDQPTAVVPGA